MMWRAGLMALALAGCANAAAQEATPDWLSGYWLSCEGGVEVAETWIGAGRGVLLGTNLTRGAAYEFMRIAPNGEGEVSFFAMPGGRSPPTTFAMVSQDGARAAFENAAHDFPQRVIYARDGDVLRARIEALDGAGAVTWTFRRAPLDARCAD
jgi:hypothetical protein